MFAIIETGGKQIKVEEGQEIYVEKLDVNEGDSFTFDKVLFVGGDSVKVGAPTVEGATVTATVNKNGRGKKSLYSHTNVVRTLNVKRPSSTIYKINYR